VGGKGRGRIMRGEGGVKVGREGSERDGEREQ